MRPSSLSRLWCVRAALTIAIAGLLVATSGCASKAAARAFTGPANPPTTSATTGAEYRAQWVTTAYNTDWPSKASLHRRVQIDEMNAIIARAKYLNCNAIFLQVRAFGDRIYRRTSLAADSGGIYEDEPWAQALNYDNDPDPNGVYDPFDEWIQACSRAGIELHAWINPYRINKLVTVKIGTDKYYLPVVKWEKQLYLDPASGEAQKYVKAVIADFLKHYPPEANVYFAAPKLREQTNYMLSAGDGPDGMVYDHQIPGPPDRIPGTGPSTGPSASIMMMAAAKTSAEKRVDWMKKVYDAAPRLPSDTKTTVKAFLDWSFDTVSTGAGAKFGLSPEVDSTYDYTTPQLTDKKVDYIVPELYGRQPTVDFQKGLRKWLDAVQDDAVVIAGLNTARVQTPANVNSDDTWLPGDILQQMDDAAATSGTTNGKKAVGVAHFGAYAMRLPDEGGPEENKNIGRKLKETKYKTAKLPPKDRRASNNFPGAPKDVTYVNRPGDGEYITWKKGPGARPRKWEVWFWRPSTNAYDPPLLIGGDTTEVKIDSDVNAVYIKAVNKFNEESQGFGKWNR